jgi:serine/threonine-protein kinase
MAQVYDPERWRKIESLFHAAYGLPASEREALLVGGCSGDAVLRGEVEALLAQSSAPDDLLEIGQSNPATRSIPPALIGQRFGAYLVDALIGVGGMGAMYRARDTRLGRDVALKMLLASSSHNPERLARFEREARVLASLSHPHIAAIYGLEEADGARALVLELVEGETLAERIGRTSGVPVREAVEIAIQIADALDAAHEKGIVHRDLKPANVKITPAGSVKVLDFGLARLAAGDGFEARDSMKSPQKPIDFTLEGVIVGTATYLSPEQARGRPVDTRSDIWALGCVLYELLAGRPAFAGDTIPDIIAGILTREPNWSALPAGTPTSIRRLLRRCLEKEPARRLRDIGDARSDLEDAFGEETVPDGHTSQAWRRAAMAAGLLALGIGAGGALMWRVLPAASRPSPEPMRFTIVPEPESPDAEINGTVGVVLSPDGSRIAYAVVTRPTVRLRVRRLTESVARTLAEWQIGIGGDLLVNPFFSPDGNWIGFFAEGRLKKVPVEGGPVVTLAAAPGPRGGTWGDDGTIVFAPLARSGLSRIPSDGGAPQPLTTLDSARGETAHRRPVFLPGAKAVLFNAQGAGYEQESVGAVWLDSGRRQIVIEQGGEPAFAATGHLLFTRDDALMAVGFDPVTLAGRGQPVPVLEGVGSFGGFSISKTGVLLSRVPGAQAGSRLVWVDRQGRADALPPPPRQYTSIRLSPDDRRVVMASRDGADQGLWIYDIPRDSFTRLTFEGSNEWPAWTPDGRRIAYASNKPRVPWDLFWKSADGSAAEEQLLAKDEIQYPAVFAPEGTLLFADLSPRGWDIGALVPGRAGPRTVLASPANERDPSVSPDGRWLAYASDESGRGEIYVQSLAAVAGKWQLSIGGGTEPVWSRSGTKVFYRSGWSMVAVDVTTGAAFAHGRPRVLFEGRYGVVCCATSYSVARDGRFLMTLPEPASVARFSLVVNWFTELEGRLPR